MTKNLKKALDSENKNENVNMIENLLELEKQAEERVFSFFYDYQNPKYGHLYEYICAEICEKEFGFSHPSHAYDSLDLRSLLVLNKKNKAQVSEIMREVDQNESVEFDYKQQELSNARDTFKDYYNETIKKTNFSSLKAVQNSYKSYKEALLNHFGKDEKPMSLEEYAETLAQNPSLFYDENTNDFFSYNG